MQGMMTILRADGTSDCVELRKKPSLEDLQKLVGGFIERVPLWNRYSECPCVVYCNEEGKLQQLSLNEQATIAWYKAMNVDEADDALVGDVVILQGDKAFMKSL